MILQIFLATIVALIIISYLYSPFTPINALIGLFMRNPPIIRSKEEMIRFFPESKILEENWKTIRGEVTKLLKNRDKIPKFHEVDKFEKNLSDKSGGAAWRTFFFKGYGNWSEKNCKLCPKTSKLLKKMPNVTTAMFSILDGKKHIPPHFGPFKGVYRYHLGLIIPKDKPCYILVDDRKYSWKEGEGVLFDDTFRHEVYNNSSKSRVVLFLDVFREDAPYLIIKLNKWLYNLAKNSKYIREAAKKAEVQTNL